MEQIDLESLKRKKTIRELLEFGIINIDKPSGPTSFNVSDFVRNQLKLKKTSHFGTLDPKVTGVLPIALNRACKLTGYFLGENKTYIGIMRMHNDISIEAINSSIKKKFTGKIIQIPPVRSRVKRQEREREIYQFEILEKDNKDILFKVKCEGGTYIRKLVDDLGKELKIGAHMLELRRIYAGIFAESDEKYPAINLYEFERAVKDYYQGNENMLRKIIIPAEIISKVYPTLKIKKDNLKQIFTGKPIYREDIIKDEGIKKGIVASVFSEERFIGMYEIFRGKEIFAKPKFVLQPIKKIKEDIFK